ncbi:hypothetical protein NQ314_001688 [Rhamnusium bicolor]|uniref:YqaJ viral recombinase domain-containing protein n=1 Tax=Rhamnusium bicolor TaxID=1586634 RepID=A0AAV8ZRK4_9CUCU|nr:hypothetical protein NQ314_001688 [Rhamnusium bicolor]
MKIISYVATTNEKIPLLQTIPLANIRAVYNDHDYLKEHPEETFLKSKFLKHISQDKIREIEYKTRGQSNNNNWLEERKYRLQSSYFGDIKKSLKNDQCAKNLSKRIIQNKDISFVPANSYGKRYELIARKKYEEISNESVNLCGVFVSKEYPFLGGSPDGITATACLEIKCPFSTRNSVITSETVPYLQLCDKDGFYKLKVDHNYYFQIQGQMLCTERRICHFVIYTNVDCLILSIARDEQFIVNMVNKLKDFYENYHKNNVFQTFLYKNYDSFF